MTPKQVLKQLTKLINENPSVTEIVCSDGFETEDIQDISINTDGQIELFYGDEDKTKYNLKTKWRECISPFLLCHKVGITFSSSSFQ